MNVNEEKLVPISATGGVRLVLNGGNDVMERATIPIQWFFAPEVIARDPRHVLIIEQSEKMHETETSHHGARYIRDVTDVVAFIQVMTPGTHTITVLVLDDTSISFDRTKQWDDRNYTCDITPSDVLHAIETGDFTELGPDVLAAAVRVVDVPRELFAPRSQTPRGEAIWNWVNRWYDETPRDECKYRGRLLFAFTLQPVLFLLGHIIRLAIQIFATALFPLIRLGVLFFGYRPNHLFAYTGEIWRWQHNRKFQQTFLSDEIEGYRVWSERDGEIRHMPVTGIELVLLGLMAWMVTFILQEGLLTTLALVGLWSLPVLLMFIVAKRFQCLLAGTDFMVSQKRESRLQWLRRLSYDQAPKKVELSNLPTAYRGQLIQRFRVGFWNAKMKVCRPFPKH